MYRYSYILVLGLLFLVAVSCKSLHKKTNKTPKNSQEIPIEHHDLGNQIESLEEDIDDLVRTDDSVNISEENKDKEDKDDIDKETHPEELATEKLEEVDNTETDEVNDNTVGDSSTTTAEDDENITEVTEGEKKEIVTDSDEITSDDDQHDNFNSTQEEFISTVSEISSTSTDDGNTVDTIYSLLAILQKHRDYINAHFNDTQKESTQSAIDKLVKELEWKSFGIGAGLGAFAMATVLLTICSICQLCCRKTSHKKEVEDLGTPERKRHKSEVHTPEKAEGSQKMQSIDDSDF